LDEDAWDDLLSFIEERRWRLAMRRNKRASQLVKLLRRVELTHDVLCGVVKSSRDLRQERESREATERFLQEQGNRERATRRSLMRARQVAAVCIVLAIFQAQLGDQVGAAATLAAETPFIARLRSTSNSDFVPALIERILRVGSASAAFERGDLREARSMSMDAAEQIRGLKSSSSFEANQVALGTYLATHVAGRASFLLGDYVAAERLEREALSNRKAWGTDSLTDKNEQNEVSMWLGMASAKQQEKSEEALREIAPVLKFRRELSARNHGDIFVPTALACALYAQSLADAPHRAALLKESAALLDAAPPAVKAMSDNKRWRELVREAQTAGGHIA
jgi:hypothetical protein